MLLLSRKCSHFHRYVLPDLHKFELECQRGDDVIVATLT